MAYVGLPPALFTNNLTNVQLIDDISGSFNGSTQTFALTSNSAPFHAVSARSLIVVLGGIVQKPQVDYTVNGTSITFTVAPVAGLTFGARNIYGLNYLDSVNDGAITPAKLSQGGPSWTSGGTVTVSGDLNVVGSFNSGTQGLFWQDNEIANFGNDNDLRIFHDGVDSFIRDFGTGNLNIYGDNEITIRNGQGSEYKARFITDGAVELYHNATKKFETTSDGIFVSGTARVPNATAFTSSDSGGTERWLMYMSGGVSPSSGNKLIIGNPLNDDVILFTNNTERLRINSVGYVSIKHDTLAYLNLEKNNAGGNGSLSYDGSIFAITSNSNAADMQLGTSSTPRVTIKVNGNVGIGTTNPLDKLHVSGGNIRTTGGYLTMFGLATPDHENYIQMTGNGTSYIGVGPEANPTIKFKIGNTSTTVLNVSSTAVTPGADNTYNLGSTSFRWANIYSADLQLSNEGSSNDVDGTWGAYTIQEGENDLFLLNRRNGKKYKFVLQEVN